MRRGMIYGALLIVLGATVRGQAPKPGTLRVTVLDEKGAPIEGAIVDAQHTVNPWDTSPRCWTDSKGTCFVAIPEMEFEGAAARSQPPVVYRLSASKYYSGYRPLWLANGTCPLATEIVTAGEIRQGRSVTLHIGPKAGIVRMTISDAETGKRLQGSIYLKWGGACPESFSVGLGISGDDRLVAPNVPVEMAVDSPGYERWEYRADAGDGKKTFVLRPEEVMTFDIRLHPKK